MSRKAAEMEEGGRREEMREERSMRVPCRAYSYRERMNGGRAFLRDGHT